MGGGGGTSPLKIQDIIHNPLGVLTNSATQVVSAGTLGYEDGKFGKGAAARAADETIGEVTGRNAMRDADARAQSAVEAEALQRQNDLNNQRQQTYVSDLQASRTAGAGRNPLDRSRAALRWSTLGQDEKDFLGL